MIFGPIVITGAGSGIGRALAIALSKKDITLVLSDISLDAVKETARLCQQPAKVTACCHDVSCPDDMLGLADVTEREHGSIASWVQCAGKGCNRHVLDLPAAELNAMFAINAAGVVNALQAAVPIFKRRGQGHFLAVSSALVAELDRSPHRRGYTVSKAAMEILLDFAQKELSNWPDIRVSCLRLPGVDTPFSANCFNAAPGAVSSSKTLLSAEAAAGQIIATLDAFAATADPAALGRTGEPGKPRQASPDGQIVKGGTQRTGFESACSGSQVSHG